MNDQMIGIDTNVLVRFLVQDDAKQAALARSLFDRCSSRTPGFIGREVLIEAVWVLERAYRQTPKAIASAIMGLLESEEIIVEQAADAVIAAMAYADGAGDFADHMITSAAVRAGCDTLYTFDRKAAWHNRATLLVG